MDTLLDVGLSNAVAASALASVEYGRSRAIRSASRTSAVPEASVSTQPRFGQLPWHGGPSRSITV